MLTASPGLLGSQAALPQLGQVQWASGFPHLNPAALGWATQPSYGAARPHFSIYAAQGQSKMQAQPTDVSQLFQIMTLQAPDNTWYMDSGARAHMSSSTGILSSHTLCKSKLIVVGDGACLSIDYLGSSILPSKNYSLVLDNILVSLHIIKNLISVRQFTKQNLCYVEFNPFGFLVKDLRTGKLILPSESSGDLYHFNPSSLPVDRPSTTSLVAVTSLTWHRRLGHLGAKVFSYLNLKNFISCNKDFPGGLCHAYQLGKHRKLPFYPSNTFSRAPFEIIHSDLWTSLVLILTGFPYYIYFLDDFSPSLWVFPLRHKSDVFDVFLNFHTYIESQFRIEVQQFQCDNGRKSDQDSFHSFFRKHGIVFCFFFPRTSQQNGKASE